MRPQRLIRFISVFLSQLQFVGVEVWSGRGNFFKQLYSAFKTSPSLMLFVEVDPSENFFSYELKGFKGNVANFQHANNSSSRFLCNNFLFVWKFFVKKEKENQFHLACAADAWNPTEPNRVRLKQTTERIFHFPMLLLSYSHLDFSLFLSTMSSSALLIAFSVERK